MFVAYELFDVVDVLFYVLFVGYWADQEHVVGVGDYVVVETVDHHEFVFAGHGEYAAGGVVAHDGASLGDVSAGVARGVVAQRAPCAQVAPADVDGFDKDVAGLFHERIVDGHRRAAAEFAGYEREFVRCAESFYAGVEPRGYVGRVCAQGFDERFGFPDEYA